MVDIVIASIIISIMLFFVFIMFKNIIKRINHNAKKYFINKLDDYNDIVEEKEKQIRELKEEIKLLNKNREELEIYRNKVNTLTKRKTPTRIASNIKVPKFREENFFYNYKELKQKFDFDKEELIKEFIKENQNKDDEKSYKVLCNFKNKFNKEAIYQLMTLQGEEQFDLLKDLLTEREKKLIDIDSIIEEKSKFSISLLLEKIDQMLIEVDPIINVYVSKYDKNYDYIDPYIRTKQYERMSEGIIIEYKGKSYDFSI